MALNDNNDKHKLEEEAESSMARKRLWLFNDDSSDDDSFDSPEEETEEEEEEEEETEEEEEEEEETEEEVSSDESLMSQIDTYEEKLVAKHGRDLIFDDDGDTTSPSLEPCTPETLSNRVRSDPDDDDDFCM
jgi:phage repressor protein C with HTH and peptisase S24 domain